jgi:hypothetical protein
MKKISILIIFMMILPDVFSQHAATRLIEYVPAPGQHINIENLGTPQAAQKMTENVSSVVSLGSFGGYIVLGFDKPCVNHPDNPYGIDFTVFGNAFSGSSEPGIIWVMKDENRNGLPDDTWYEIAGSHHFHSSTLFSYEVTYFKTGTRDVLWRDNYGKTGVLPANNFNLQEYYPSFQYFPHYPPDSVSFSGTLLNHVIDDVIPGEIKIFPTAFGYADSHARKQGADLSLPDNPYTREVEGAGGNPVDISWAIDAQGNYTEPDTIHFIKIVSASLATVGWLGEISTDVAWVQSTIPNKALTGKETMLVVYHYQPKIVAGDYLQLEANFFLRGRKQDKVIEYESYDEETATVDSAGKLKALRQGTTRINVTAGDDTENIDIKVVIPDSILFLSSFSSVYPGDSINFQVKILDNEGGVLDIPVQFHSSDSMVGSIIERGGKRFFLARQPGETWLSAVVPGFETSTQIRVHVLSPDDKIRVLFSVKKEDENMFPLQWIYVDATDINSMVENRRKDYSIIKRPVVANVIAAGLEKAGAGYLFRDDEAGDENLYLYKVEKEGVFTYGWGGKTEPSAYARGWVVSRNRHHIINDFDQTEVAEGDTIVLYHVSNIQNDWVFKSLMPHTFNAGPGDVIEVLLEQKLCSLEEGKIVTGAPTPVAGAEIMAGQTYLTGIGGKAEVYAGNSFPFIISSGSDAVLISAGNQTTVASLKSIVWKVFPNPVEHDIYISAGGSFRGSEPAVNKPVTDSPIKVKIYNLWGQIYIEEELLILPHRIGLSLLPQGIYHLVIYNQDHVETHKIWKR